MTERPILFSAPMVRALLDGSKTQTRRLWKMPLGMGWYVSGALKGEETGDICDLSGPGWCTVDEVRSPYGQPGDQLWVREAWARTIVGTGTEMVVYREGDNRTDYGGPWKPGIHMFRRDSRITLEVTGMRVERLQDISEADAKAEGCERLDDDEPGYIHREEPDWKLCLRCGGTRLYTAFNPATGGALPGSDCTECDTYVKRYRRLWESINGPDSWAANPWVWVVQFKKVSP